MRIPRPLFALGLGLAAALYVLSSHLSPAASGGLSGASLPDAEAASLRLVRSSMTGGRTPAGPDTLSQPAGQLPEHVPGEVLVRLQPGLRLFSAPLAATVGARETGRVEGLDLVRWKLPPGLSVEEAVEHLRQVPAVAHVQPNRVYRADATPNDPCYAGTFACGGGPGISQAWYAGLIGLPGAWDLTQGGVTVSVAVLDTGADLTHPDLAPNLDVANGRAFISPERPDSCGPAPVPAPSNPSDDDGHGTMVSGIIGAVGNNGTGVTGVAWRVRILPVKVLDANGCGTDFDVIQGIDYAVQRGVRIINLSLGGAPFPGYTCDTDPTSVALKDAVDRAAAAGVVVVAAAGNDSDPVVSCPAGFSNAVAVSASGYGGTDPWCALETGQDDKASFSNWGPEIDLAAPGVCILSTLPGGYAYSDGTSFSAPLVSGAAALLVGLNPFLDRAAVVNALISTADPLPDGGFANWDGAGRVNAGAAVAAVPTAFRARAAGIAR